MRDLVSLAPCIEQTVAFDAGPGLKGARRVVKTTMDDAAVSAGHALADVGLSFENHHGIAIGGERLCNGAADDASANDCDFNVGVRRGHDSGIYQVALEDKAYFTRKVAVWRNRLASRLAPPKLSFMNKNTFFALVLGIFPSLTMAAGGGMNIQYDVEQGVGKEARKMEGRYFIQPNFVRFEVSSVGHPEQDTVVIGHASPKKAFLLFPSRKTFMEVPSSAMADKAAEKAMEPFKATGKTQKIAGYSCDVVARDLADRHEEACTSKELLDVLKNLETTLPQSSGGSGRLPSGMNGFPLEYKTMKKGEKGTVDMTMRVKELKKETFSASIFQVPTEFKKEEIKLPDPKMLQEMLQKYNQKKE